MKDRLIKNLEALLEEKDPEKIKEIMAAITVNSDFVKSENIMQRVNTYADEKSKESRAGIEKIIEDLKKEGKK